MNELAVIKNNQAVTSSRIVAEHFEKDHNELKKKIRDLQKDMGGTPHIYFHEAEYSDSMNRIQTEYLMNRDGFSLLAMGFTGLKALTFKMDFIEAFNLMEAELNSPAAIMARALSIAQDTINNLGKTIEMQKPKVEFFDQVACSKDAIEMGDVAKALNIKGVGRNKLFEILRERKILMNDNIPYQKYCDSG